MTDIKKGVVLNYLNMAIGSLIPLFYTPIMLRLLGQDEYGLYKLSSSVTGYLGLLSMGIGSAILRNLIKARTEGGHTEEQRVFSLFLVIYKCIAALILLVGAILVFNLNVWYADSLDSEALHKMQVLVAIMACQSAMSFILGPYYSMITAHEKYIFAQSIGIFLTVLGPVSNLIALFLGYASIGIAISSFIVNFLGQIIYILYVRAELGFSTQYRNLPWNLLHNIFLFSFWSFLGEITGLLYNSTDTLMIGATSYLGTNAVAVYSIGTVFSGMLLSFTSGISSVLAPRVNRFCFEGMSNKELTDFGIKVGRLQMYIVSLAVCSFASFGYPFLKFYAGVGYDDAYWIALVTMIPASVPLVQTVFLNVVMARFQHQFRSVIYLIIAIVNVIGTYYILPYWGIIGAASVSGIAAIIGHGFAMNWFYKKHTGIEVFRFWKSVIPLIIIPCFLLFFVYVLIDTENISLYMLILDFSSFIIIWYILNYVFVFNDYERGLFSFLKSK